MLPIKVFIKGRIFYYYTGFSFFIFIFISRLEKQPERLERHEKIHFMQQVEMLFIIHWILYLLCYAYARVRGATHYHAYRFNPFEIEAYTHDRDIHYLKRRRPFAWLKYFHVYLDLMKQPARKSPGKKTITYDD